MVPRRFVGLLEGRARIHIHALATGGRFRLIDRPDTVFAAMHPTVAQQARSSTSGVVCWPVTYPVPFDSTALHYLSRWNHSPVGL